MRGADHSFDQMLGSVAARRAAPGGGSAAAWAGALAAALVEMAARFADAAEPAARADELRAELVAAGERELGAYEPVLEATRLPAEDPARAERLETALVAASDSPLAIARATAELAELGAAVAGHSKPALVADAVTGVLLAEAACRAAARMVEVNLAGPERDPRVDEAEALADRAAAARGHAIEGA